MVANQQLVQFIGARDVIAALGCSSTIAIAASWSLRRGSSVRKLDLHEPGWDLNPTGCAHRIATADDVGLDRYCQSLQGRVDHALIHDPALGALPAESAERVRSERIPYLLRFCSHVLLGFALPARAHGLFHGGDRSAQC
jgi:hypothetical protein